MADETSTRLQLSVPAPQAFFPDAHGHFFCLGRDYALTAETFACLIAIESMTRKDMSAEPKPPAPDPEPTLPPPRPEQEEPDPDVVGVPLDPPEPAPA